MAFKCRPLNAPPTVIRRHLTTARPPLSFHRSISISVRGRKPRQARQPSCRGRRLPAEQSSTAAHKRLNARHVPLGRNELQVHRP